LFGWKGVQKVKKNHGERERERERGRDRNETKLAEILGLA